MGVPNHPKLIKTHIIDDVIIPNYPNINVLWLKPMVLGCAGDPPFYETLPADGPSRCCSCRIFANAGGYCPWQRLELWATPKLTRGTRGTFGFSWINLHLPLATDFLLLGRSRRFRSILFHTVGEAPGADWPLNSVNVVYYNIPTLGAYI